MSGTESSLKKSKLRRTPSQNHKNPPPKNGTSVPCESAARKSSIGRRFARKQAGTGERGNPPEYYPFVARPSAAINQSISKEWGLVAVAAADLADCYRKCSLDHEDSYCSGVFSRSPGRVAVAP
jgi:hypothetical protein